MVEKRPLDDLESCNVISPAKHARQTGDELVLFSEFIPSTENASLKQPNSADCEGEVGHKNSDTRDSMKLEELINAEIPMDFEYIGTLVPGSNHVPSWLSSNTNEDESQSETPIRATFVPDHQDIYSILLRHPPCKLVPIGPDHQVDIPVCNPLHTKDISHHTEESEAAADFELTAVENDDRILMGICVIPMPHPERSISDSKKVGSGRTDCSCLDEGSIRCVRKHVMEAREKLRETLGLDTFVDLGFCNMGEQVADKWSREEEQLFHKVIFSNPVSLGKNFWHGLSVIFPSRIKKEIVSYYFNVFILRRRAEQNRCDTMNTDSDNDEWQETDDFGDNEEDEEVSVVESPVLIDHSAYGCIQEDDFHVYEEVSADENYDHCEVINFSTVNNPKKFFDNHGSDPVPQLSNKIHWDERADQDNQDDSCTSTDTGPCSQATQAKDDSGKHCLHSFDGLGSGRGHDYFLEASDAKMWNSNSGYLNCPDNKIDFLPTCSMIKEVFGDELQGRDSKTSS